MRTIGQRNRKKNANKTKRHDYEEVAVSITDIPDNPGKRYLYVCFSQDIWEKKFSGYSYISFAVDTENGWLYFIIPHTEKDHASCYKVHATPNKSTGKLWHNTKMMLTSPKMDFVGYDYSGTYKLFLDATNRAFYIDKNKNFRKDKKLIYLEG